MNMLVVLATVSLFLAVLFLGLYVRERKHRLRLANELARASGEIAQGRVRDGLTGLLSRTGFEGVLDKATTRVDTAGGAFCLLYVAVDNFGLLNDAFGRVTADRLLQHVS